MTKYFIKKDFLGFPLGILKSEYQEDLSGNFYRSDMLGSRDFVPNKIKKNSKIANFNNLEDILNFKICNCGKEDCTYNNELYRIVKEKILNNV